MAGRIILETARLVLREFMPDDADVFLKLCSDPAITRYTGDAGMTTVEEARAGLLARPIADYARHGFGRWACVWKETGQVIGFNGLKYLEELNDVDLGYRLLPEFWGRGVATEGARPVLEHGFAQLGLTRIIGLVMPENVASVRILQKLGMRLVGMVDCYAHPAAKYIIERG